MHSNHTIYNELKELNSTLTDISNRNIYTVPDGYFDVLSHDILLAIQQKDLEIPTHITVPEGYFDGLADSIMDKIKAGFAHTDETSTLLLNIKNKNPYQVPVGYFDNLSPDIINKIPQPAKVVVMKKRSSFFNYAAAAVITGIIGLSVISVFDKKQMNDSIAPSNEMAINSGNIDKEFATLTDADIVNFLQKDGQDVNAALVASIADDNNLPDQVDYLTDDKTLDNLLNELKPAESTNN